MSSLLSPFHFGQKHAYFHARITIHELANVPLIDGSFKTRWRVKNPHNLQNIPIQPTDEALEKSEDGERRTLQHKKSFASSIASQEMTRDSSKSDRHQQHHQQHLTADAEHPQRERKISNRFLSGFKDVLHKGTRRPSSSNETRLKESSDDRPSSEHSHAGHKEHARHPKEESYDSITQHRPKRTSSFNDAASAKMSSLSSRTIEDEKDRFHPSSQLHLEPRGETDHMDLKDHGVKWEKTIDVGVRIPVIKHRLVDKGSGNNNQVATASGALQPPGANTTEIGMASGSSGATATRNSMSSAMSDSRHKTDSKSSEGESRADKLDKEVKDKDKDREMADVWGMLGHTELKLTVKAEISTERTRHKDADYHVTMGYVSINLAELAPYPESSNHQHHHHHHFPHHHHHHHAPILFRADTRRYLLLDSRNNATLKITVEMTHVGGTREYAVPAARTGLLVTGAASMIHNLVGGRGSDSEPHSDASHSTEGHGNDASRPGLGEHRYSGHPNDSMASFRDDPISNWPADSVARHGRIPSSNLKTELSHQDAARAVKEAGGQRMGFSFGAGAHHERPPEDVIDSLFNPSPSKSFQSRNRSDKTKTSSTSSPKKQSASQHEDSLSKQQEKKSQQSQQQVSEKQADRGIYPETPPHFDSLSPAENPKDSAQSRGEPLSRLPSEPGAEEDQPGPDIGREHQHHSSHDHETSKSSPAHNGTQHSRNSSAGTVKSILTNALTPRSSLNKKHTGNMARTHSSGPSSYDTSGDTMPSKSSHTSTTSGGGRASLVHWDENVGGDHEKEQTPPTTVLGGDIEIPVVKSPPAMSRDISEESFLANKPTQSPLKNLPFTGAEEEEEIHHTWINAFKPPDMPPEGHFKQQGRPPKDSNDVSMDLHIGSDSTSSRKAKGLSKEEAMKQGYRGAGWGTMAPLWPYSMTDGPDLHPFEVHNDGAMSRSAEPV